MLEAKRKNLPQLVVQPKLPLCSLKMLCFWLILIIALVGGATTGVFYFYVQPQCQILKSAWRMLGFTISIIPLAYYEYQKQKNNYIYSRENILNLELWKKITWASFWYLLWTVGFLISINHVSVAQANLLTNLSPIIIVVYNVLKGKKVSNLELIGTALATAGACFLAFDSEVHSSEGMVDVGNVSGADRFVFGVVVGICGSIGAAFCLTNNQELKYSFPICLSTMIMSFLVFLQAALASVIFEGATLSFDPQNGVFGLFSSEWIVLHLYIVVITGYGGYFAYIISVKYFDALLVAVVLTLEPVVSALIVYGLGWQSFPGILTIIGCTCILPGIIAVVAGGEKETQKEVKSLETGIPLLGEENI